MQCSPVPIVILRVILTYIIALSEVAISMCLNQVLNLNTTGSFGGDGNFLGSNFLLKMRE